MPASNKIDVSVLVAQNVIARVMERLTRAADFEDQRAREERLANYPLAARDHDNRAAGIRYALAEIGLPEGSGPTGLIVGPNRAYWLGRDRQRLSDEALHKQLAEQRGKYASLGHVGPATTAAEMSTVGGAPPCAMGNRTERWTPADARCLETDISYLMEFLQKLREHDIWDDVADALDDNDTPTLTTVTDVVMQRVAQRLRDGHWDHTWWERWLDGDTAPPATTEPVSTVGGACRKPCCVRGAALLAQVTPPAENGTEGRR